MGIRTQGDGHARHARIALPWADMSWPLRGRNTIIRKSKLQQRLIVLAGVEVALCNEALSQNSSPRWGEVGRGAVDLRAMPPSPKPSLKGRGTSEPSLDSATLRGLCVVSSVLQSP